MSKKISRLTLNIPKREPLLAETLLPETRIDMNDGSVTAPVTGPDRPPRYCRRMSLSVTKQMPSGTRGRINRAMSRTFTLTSLSTVSMNVDEWRRIFDKLDLETDGRTDGKVYTKRFKKLLKDNPLWETVPKDFQETILINVDKREDTYIDFDEFHNLMNGSQFHEYDSRQRREFRDLVRLGVKHILPYQYQYQNQYSCSPPPLFLILLSLIQLTVFIYNNLIVEGSPLDQASCSHMVFDPSRRFEIWRYATYMFIHSSYFHFGINILAQLALGVPLEMVHGWWRVMLVYLSGIIAGAFGTNIVLPSVYLSGASSGTYALIAAHLATVIMNFREMTWPWSRLILAFLFCMSELAVYLYKELYQDMVHELPVSYPAHLAGALAGLLVGIICLKNLSWEKYERYIWAASIIVFTGLMCYAITFSIVRKEYFDTATKNISTILTLVHCERLPFIL